MTLECLDYFFAIRGRNDVSDKRFGAQLPDADLSFGSQRMVARHHENQLIKVYDNGVQLRFVRIVSENAQLGVVPQHVARNVAAERTLHHDFDHGMATPEFGQHRQQIERCKFVSGDGQLAALQLAKFRQRSRGDIAQIQQALGVFLQDAPRVGQQAVAGRAIEQRLADVLFQLVNGLAHRRLGAVQLFRGAGKFSFLRHR